MGVRVIVRRNSVANVKKAMNGLKRQGYIPLMEEPVLDTGNLYYHEMDYYVMVMEHPTKKASRVNIW